MTTKDWLSRGWKIDNEIDALLEAQSRLKAEATRCTSRMDAVPGGGNGEINSNERFIVAYLQLEEKINKKIDDLVIIKSEIMKAIDTVENSELRALLVYRYINCKTWDEIAYRMNYSLYYVSKEMHKKALKNINTPENPALQCGIMVM